MNSLEIFAPIWTKSCKLKNVQDFLTQDKCFQFPSFLARFIVVHFLDQLWNSPTGPRTSLPTTMKKIFCPDENFPFDAIASPSTYPCQSVSESFIVSDERLLSHLRVLRACLCLLLFRYKSKQKVLGMF